MTHWLARIAIVVVAILLIAGLLDAVLAQGTPFGVPKGAAPKGPPAPPPADGFFGGIISWIMAKQSQYYREFSVLIRNAKADGSAVWGLLGVSFLYGIFHAAGPGHGKAVISSYVVANQETWRRGVALSFASALLQALVAVAVVGIASVLLSATAPTMQSAVVVIEIVSYAFIIAIGVRLLRVKGVAFLNAWRGRELSPVTRAVAGVLEVLCYVAIILVVAPRLIAVGNPAPVFATIGYALVGAACLALIWLRASELLAAWRAPPRTVSEVGAAVTPQDHGHAHDHHAHTHDHHAHDHHAHDHAHGHEAHAHHAHEHHDVNHAQHDHAHHDHAHDHHGHHHDHHDDASAWGHAHAPEPEELAGPGGWRRGLSAIVAVGMRPCSGAILVLVFALAQGLLWAGVAATFVMGLGTAITVAVIATIAIGARSFASRLAGGKSGWGMVAMRGIEVGAALVIIAFGSLLLTGYMVSGERLGV